MRQKIKFPHRAKPVEREVRQHYAQYYIRHGDTPVPVICVEGEWRIAPGWEWVYERKGARKDAVRSSIRA
jgi:hypothetical protein